MYRNDLLRASEFQTSLFADDTYLCLSDINVNNLHIRVNAELQNINFWRRKNKLSLNYNKTNFRLIKKQEMESRTQGSRPRPRTQKKSEAKAKDSLSEDRHSRGQGQECSRPRPRTKDTSASAPKKKKKVFTKIFQAISTKTRFPKYFSSAPQNFNNSKNSAVLEPRTGQFLRT